MIFPVFAGMVRTTGFAARNALYFPVFAGMVRNFARASDNLENFPRIRGDGPKTPTEIPYST